jgi:hypothetical protein
MCLLACSTEKDSLKNCKSKYKMKRLNIVIVVSVQEHAFDRYIITNYGMQKRRKRAPDKPSACIKIKRININDVLLSSVVS